MQTSQMSASRASASAAPAHSAALPSSRASRAAARASGFSASRAASARAGFASGIARRGDAYARRASPVARASDASLSWSGKGVSPPAKGSHFLHLDDFTGDELQAMITTAADVKAKIKAGEDYKPLKGKTMSMIFTKPSMRTRVSFETVRWR